MAKRRTFTAVFKARVAEEARCGNRTVLQIADLALCYVNCLRIERNACC